MIFVGFCSSSARWHGDSKALKEAKAFGRPMTTAIEDGE